MFLAAAILITLAILVFTFGVRTKDLPDPIPVPPYKHLEDRKAVIYENLRDLNFEYRVGKLSDEDYKRTKLELQSELATVLAGIDRLKGAEAAPAPAAKPSRKPPAAVCPHCKASFDRPLKFCGECGKPMVESA